MKILAFVSGNSGPSYHRVIIPLLMMRDADVFITNDLRVEHFEEKQPDIFMYNRILPDHAMPQLIFLKEKYGFKTCVDIDDYWELDEHHIMYQEYIETGFAQKQIQHLKDADIVITTHERLAQEARTHNANVHVCPNAIPHRGQFDIERQPYYLTRLFWQGSITHRADIELLEKPIDMLASISGKIKMIMAGYTESEDEWYRMAMIYTANTKHQYKLIPGNHVSKYYSAYAEADICLVPLVNSRFNRHKSNLKILEAANLGLPVIASNVHPYIGMPVLLCKHSGDWVKHITKLVNSRGARRDAGRTLKDYCDKHFNFETINEERKQILEYAASKINA